MRQSVTEKAFLPVASLVVDPKRCTHSYASRMLYGRRNEVYRETMGKGFATRNLAGPYVLLVMNEAEACTRRPEEVPICHAATEGSDGESVSSSLISFALRRKI